MPTTLLISFKLTTHFLPLLSGAFIPFCRAADLQCYIALNFDSHTQNTFEKSAHL